MEEWRAAIGYEGKYQVSSLGRIKSLLRGGRILKPRKRSGGYLAVNLGTPRKDIPIHHMVLMAFSGPRLGLQANHKNGIKTDNSCRNLEWCSAKENIQHSKAMGTHNTGRGPRRNNLSPEEVTKIRSSKDKNKDLGRAFNVHPETIRRVRNYKVFRNI